MGYLVFTSLSALSLLIAWKLGRVVVARGRWRWVAAAGLYTAACLFLLFLVPGPRDEIPPSLSDLVPRFRALSAGGLVLFWLIVGGAFGPLHVAFAGKDQTARSRTPGPR